MNGPMDLERARHSMRRAGIDALLLCTPENLYYATSYSSALLDLYRRAPVSIALLPREKNMAPALIVPAPDVQAAQRISGVQDVQGFPVWWDLHESVKKNKGNAGEAGKLPTRTPMVETGQLPEQYDRLVICRLLHGILDKRRLLGSRIGLELDFVDVNTYSALTQVCPQNDFVDSTSLLYDLRSIKNQAEVDALRHACMLTESGIRAAAGQISQGAKVANLAEALLKGIWSAAGEHGLWDELGSITGRPELGGQMGLTENSRVLCAGTTVKFDVQVSVSRYHADVGRTYVAGEPSSAVRRIHRALHGAHTRARDALRPGTRLCDVFRLTLDSIHRAGFSDYRRGHFGHSVGLDPKIEEPPFISATERCPLSPGMVLALETPFYAPGIGMFQLEDMCLISEDGCEVLSCLPRQLEWLRDDM